MMPIVVSVAMWSLLAYSSYELLTTLCCWLASKAGQSARSPNAVNSLTDRIRFHVTHTLPLRAAFLLRQVPGAVVTTLCCLFPSLGLPVTHALVVQAILESSLVLFVTPEPDSENGTLATLRLQDFAMLHLPERSDSQLTVRFDLVTKKVVAFWLDGVAITKPAEMLAVLTAIDSCVTHPLLSRAFGDRRRSARPTAAVTVGGRAGGVAVAAATTYDELSLRGSGVENAAHHFPYLCFGVDNDRFQRLVAVNRERRLPRFEESLQALAPHSRLCRFLLAARPVVSRLVDQHSAPVDTDAFLMAAVIVPVDHFAMRRATRWRKMEAPQVSGKWVGARPNLAAYGYYSPMAARWSGAAGRNLLAQACGRNAFYADLFGELQSIDLELAEQISLSLA